MPFTAVPTPCELGKPPVSYELSSLDYEVQPSLNFIPQMFNWV